MYTAWEYKVVSLDQISPPNGRAFDSRLTGALSNFGRQGWELAGTVDGEGNDVFLCLKRPNGETV